MLNALNRRAACETQQAKDRRRQPQRGVPREQRRQFGGDAGRPGGRARRSTPPCRRDGRCSGWALATGPTTLTGLFRLSNGLPHCSGAMSAYKAGAPAASTSAATPSAGTIPARPACRWCRQVRLAEFGRCRHRARPHGATHAPAPALEMPFCIETTNVPAGNTRPSTAAAAAVAPLLTHNNAKEGMSAGEGASFKVSLSTATVRTPPSRSVNVRP